MERAAEGMRRKGVVADAILSSPFLRARETAAIVARCLGIFPDRVETLEELASGAKWGSVQIGLRPFGHLASVILVGHQPDLSEMAADILGSGTEQVPFSPGSLARIQVDSIPPLREATLEWLLTLDELERSSGR